MVIKRVRHDFQKFKTIKSSGGKIYNRIITLNDLYEEQINLNDGTDRLKEYMKPKNLDKKEKKH